ncbi:MAG: glycosyltransferase, partial [Minisyncoccia bacterium]
MYALTIGIVASTFLLSPHSRNDFPLIRAFIIVFASILLTKYFLYMILAPWSDVAVALQHRRFGARPYTPLVSVIILAWNEEVGIVQTVRTILQSTYRNVEVIVVNDGSTDNSDRIMREFVAKHERVSAHAGGQKINLKYFYKENGGKGRALNYGLAQAQGDIVISIDADCALTPETIGNFVTCFRDPKVMAAVGNVKIGSTRSLIGTVQHLEFLFSFYFKKAESLLNTIYIIGGAAGAFRREVLERLNGYDSSNITEDIELSVRIQKAGMKIVYASEAIVYTEGASTITGLMKQRLRWKRGRFQTFRQHRDLFFSLSRSHNKWLTCLM